MESIEATLHSSEQLSPETLSAFFDALKPGGRLGVFVKGGGEQDSSSAIAKRSLQAVDVGRIRGRRRFRADERFRDARDEGFGEKTQVGTRRNV